MTDDSVYALAREVSALAAHVETFGKNGARLAEAVERIDRHQASLDARVASLERGSDNDVRRVAAITAAVVGSIVGVLGTALAALVLGAA